VFRILAINPGSTSTKISLFEDEQELFSQNLHHTGEELSPFVHISEQLMLRFQAIETFLKKNKIRPNEIDAFVGRGGLLSPISSGTYLVNDKMLEDLQKGVQGEHASNLGGILAQKLASPHRKLAFIVDPVVVDEMEPLARLSGHPELPRKSIFHALNQKAVGRKAALLLGKNYFELSLIIAHLGGGISVAAHRNGRVVDVNNALDGDGPYSPERSGTLPAGDLMRLCFSGKFSQNEVQKMIVGKGGVMAYLASNDMRFVEQKSRDGDQMAGEIYQGMAYQVAKEIGSQSVVLFGKVDAIVLTGGIAHDKMFISLISERVQFLAPILTIPGEEEMEALALGALRVLRNEEPLRTYEP
jgi:butyrate kinase